MKKKLCKSQDRKIFGVCGGIAEYFNIDPVIVRLIAVIAVVLGFGTGVLIYIIAGFVMPEPSLDEMENETKDDKNMKSAKIDEEDEAFDSYFEKKDKK